MNVLYNNAHTVWPGMEIGWIGDLSHQGEVSGHNPDDWPPLQAEQIDADTDPEVRALDFMIGPHFTAADASRLTHALATGVDRNRLYYVIYNRLIYKRSNNYEPTPYTGTDPHTNHVHASGRAVDDANSSDWTSVLALGDDMSVDDVIVGQSQLYDKAANRSDPTGRNFANDVYRVQRSGDGFLATDPTLKVRIEQLEAKLDLIIASLANTPPGGITTEQVRTVVRDELDKTKLIASP